MFSVECVLLVVKVATSQLASTMVSEQGSITGCLCSAAWTCATIGSANGVKLPKLFNDQEQQAIKWPVNEGILRDFADTAWMFATLGGKSQKLFLQDH